MGNKSEILFDDAKTVIPGGVNSPVRAFRAVDRNPLFINHAKGSHIFDEDGGEKQDQWLLARMYMTKVFRYSRPSSGIYGSEFYDNWTADLFYKTRETVIHDFADEFYLTDGGRERTCLIWKFFIYNSF